MNTCRTCSTFSASGGFCAGLYEYPNVTIAEYGSVTGAEKMMAEIYQRGPIAAGVNAEPILDYKDEIFTDESADKGVNHVISIIGWGFDETL